MILITGSHGFIGTALRKKLGCGFLCVDKKIGLDFTNYRHIEWLLDHNQVDTVVHLAAEKRVGEPCMDLNYTKTKEFYNMCMSEGVKKFIFASTAAVYGECGRAAWETMSLNPISEYGESKVLAENAIRDRGAILRIFNAYGPGGGGVLDKIHDKDFTLYGNPVRDFIHVDDVANAFVEMINNYSEGSVKNVGTGNPTEIKTLFTKKYKISHAKPGDIQFSVSATRNFPITKEYPNVC